MAKNKKITAAVLALGIMSTSSITGEAMQKNTTDLSESNKSGKVYVSAQKDMSLINREDINLIRTVSDLYSKDGKIGVFASIDAKDSSLLGKIELKDSKDSNKEHATQEEWLKAIESIHDELTSFMNKDKISRVAINLESGKVVNNGFIRQDFENINVKLSSTASKAIADLKSKGYEGYYSNDDTIFLYKQNIFKKNKFSAVEFKDSLVQINDSNQDKELLQLIKSIEDSLLGNLQKWFEKKDNSKKQEPVYWVDYTNTKTYKGSKEMEKEMLKFSDIAIQTNGNSLEITPNHDEMHKIFSFDNDINSFRTYSSNDNAEESDTVIKNICLPSEDKK